MPRGDGDVEMDMEMDMETDMEMAMRVQRSHDSQMAKLGGFEERPLPKVVAQARRRASPE